jgi:hypothetical protein
VRSEGILQLDPVALASQTTPKAYGTLFGQALFRGEVRDAFVRARAGSEDRLRFLLCIEDSDLKTLRWERLCAPLEGGWDFLALDQRVPFSLYLPSLTDRRFPPIGRRDLRALVLVASPEGLEHYRLAPFDSRARSPASGRRLGRSRARYWRACRGRQGRRRWTRYASASRRSRTASCTSSATARSGTGRRSSTSTSPTKRWTWSAGRGSWSG